MKKILDHFEVYIGTALTMLMVTILFLNVVGRYIVKASIPWAEEVCLMLFALSTYFGACGAVRSRQHLRVEVLIGSLKPKSRMIMEIISNIVFMFFNGFMLFGIMPLVMQLYRNGTAAAVTGIPKFLVYMWLPILFVLMTIRLLQDCVQHVKDYKDDPTGEKKAAAELAAMQEAMLVEDDGKEEK